MDFIDFNDCGTTGYFSGSWSWYAFDAVELFGRFTHGIHLHRRPGLFRGYFGVGSNRHPRTFQT